MYHPRTFVHNRSGDLSHRERDGIVSSLGTFPKVIRRPQSSRMKRDCIIPGHLSIIDPVTSVIENVMGLYHPWEPSLRCSETSVFENEEGLYHPGTFVHNRIGDLGHQERDGIVSSLGTFPKVIRRPRSSRMKRYCIIPGNLSIIYSVTSVLEKVVGMHHPWTSS